MIYTSYFANLKKFPSTIKPIATCVSVPFWFKGDNDARLAPSQELLWLYKAGECTMLDYWDRYQVETLSKLNPISVYHELCCCGTDVALLCYEHPSDFCHRFIISHWLTQSTGIPIREYGCDQHIVFGG